MSSAQDITKGGTGQSTAPGARIALGLEIGVDVQAFDDGLQALADYDTDGFLVQTAEDAFEGREILGTTDEITVTNGDGVAGNPVVSLPVTLVFTGKTITGGTFGSGSFSGTADLTGTFDGTLLGTFSGDATGTFNGTVGATTPSTGVFTAITGPLTGNVTGNLTGNSNGAHNGTVGATTPSTGAFTTVTTSSNLTIGGTIASTGQIGTSAAYFVDGVQVVSNRNTGWGTDGGASDKTGLSTYNAPAISNPPTQAQVQTIANQVQDITRKIKAMTDMLILHGLIGP